MAKLRTPLFTQRRRRGISRTSYLTRSGNFRFTEFSDVFCEVAFVEMCYPADVPIRRDGVLFPRRLRNGVGSFVLSSSAQLNKEIGMRRTLLLLFSTAA